MNNLIALKLDVTALNRLHWFVFVSPVVIYLLWALLVYGFKGLWYELSSIGALTYLFSIACLTIGHEALHVIAGLAVGGKLENYSFGFDKESLSVDCICRDELSIGEYKLFLLAPFMVLNPLFLVLGLTSGAQLWWVMLMLSISGCSFDLAVLTGLRGLPEETRIIPEFEGKEGLIYLKAVSS